MGSFNTTCAVSNTPIREGDKVRLFFLLSHRFSYNFDPLRNSISQGCQCYPHDDFTVIGGISLEAEYTDYNTYSFDQESIFANYIHSIILRDYEMNVSEEGKEYNPYHDHMDVPKSDLTWEKIQDMMHSGRLHLRSYGNCNLPFVTTMAIHESVYQIMLNEPFERYIGYPDGMDYRSDFHPYETVDFNSLLANELTKNNSEEIEKRTQELIEIFKDQFEAEPEKEDEILNMIKRMVKRELSSRRDNGYEYAYAIMSPLEELRELAETSKTDEENEVEFTPFTDVDLISKTFEGRFFDGRMYTHNIMYRPIITSGQEHDLTSDGIFWMKVGAALMTINDRWESEEHFGTTKYSEQWQEMTYDQMIAGIKEWYEETDEEYSDFVTSLNELFKDKHEIEIKVEDFKNPEYKFISMYIWNKMLPLRILKN
ncbi:hypothetical protein pEaSNUABM47_00372 [Erwinia phage pEa_SNUABM_47]|uniref:Uncharacterized protein n=1 Tax=Erwinia phage pEa_SNUABM_47 TaxID=2768774 RepID=A0A7L8ZN00_9CAUD|nr:hypothetical protein pEaSNUABM47_00372 [Erwinia phage pEa_SNUABM_47]QXO12622.1 hypothetical protein pEaSNUABM49_00377 [Erwinia phage pEa_SNUABM_49]